MFRASFVAAAIAAGLLAAPAPAALPGGTPVNSGDRIQGTIDGVEDSDAFLVDAPEGALLRVDVKAKGSGGLMPTLTLTRPDGTPVDLDLILQGLGTPRVLIEGYPSTASGTWKLEISGWMGTSGDYQAVLSTVAPNKVRETIEVPAGARVDPRFTAWDGVTVSWSVKEVAGPGLASANLCCPHDQPLPGTDAVRRGRKLVGPRAVLSEGPGLYGVVLAGGAEGTTTVSVKASLKFPRVRKRRLNLAAEPRPLSMAPTQGRDGTLVTVHGAGFTADSRVIFGGLHEGSGTTLNPDGSLTVACPACPESEQGLAVTLDVVNADGQSGRAPAPFKYLGSPRAQSVSPMLAATEGGGTVIVGGTLFRAGFAVEFDGVPATGVVLLSPTTMSCTPPAHAEGVVDVIVRDEFGRPGAPITGFRFADAPTVASASPSSVPSFGGRTVTLTGAHFTPGSRVFVNGTESASVSVASWTSLSFLVPPGAAGAADLEVRDALDRSDSSVGILAYALSLKPAVLPAPTKGTSFFGDHAASADCDGDGIPDLVITTSTPKLNTNTNQTAPSTRLLVADGGGGFVDRTTTLPFPNSRESNQGAALVLGDLDGDETAEIVISNATPVRTGSDYTTYAGLPAYYLTEIPDVFDPPTLRATRILARSGGSFSEEIGGTVLPEPTTPPAGGLGERWQASSSAMGDLDGDGTEDLLLVAGGEIRGGTFADIKWVYAKVQYGYYPYYYYNYVRQKSLVTEEWWVKGAVRPLINSGEGALLDLDSGPGLLLDQAEAVLDDFSGAACALGDLDGDGIPDLVSVKRFPALREVDGSLEEASAVRVLRNDGWGNLAFEPLMTGTTYAAGNSGSYDFHQGTAAALGDLDGDGDLDLVVGRDEISYWTDKAGAARVLPAIRILRNDPGDGLVEDTGGFLPDALFRTGGGPTILGVRSIALVDLDGDGDLDMILTGRETTVAEAGGGKGSHGILDAGTRLGTRVLLNDGEGGFTDATEDWLCPAAGDLLAGDAVTTLDANGDGRPDIAVVLDQSPGTGLSPLRVFIAE